MKPIQTGIERLVSDPPRSLRGKRLGLLANPASVDRRFQHSRCLVEDRFPGQLKALFSPQHGFFAEKQDNMITSDDMVDPVLKIPVFSLYGHARTPTKEMLEQIDTLIIDLQDVGTRVYTFVYTMALCLQAAQSNGKQVIVLDRPNPLGGNLIEGNCLRPEYASFVGMYPVPMRHGFTIGELALLFNNHFGIGSELTVVTMAGWKRDMLFADTGLPWIPPSPNLPTPMSAMVYPGQVLLEGTNISEGRGTAQPFEICGAPFMDIAGLIEWLTRCNIDGVHLRPLAFEPTSNKWQRELCYGFQLHVIEPKLYRPYRTTLALLQAVVSLQPEAFQWKTPPYEYEFEKLPFDLITGDPAVRKGIEDQEPLEALEQSWIEGQRDFEEIRRPYLLYE
ncbi:MAG: DUF1343 domain-containing protein [Desulfobacterales bacterium]|nr:DUF1343 domain-containing protein [Desulfobacterales bacterium]